MNQITWQDYVDYIKAKGNIEDCAIIDSTDGFCWASTPSFSLSTYMGTVVMEDGTEKEVEIKEAENLVQIISGAAKPPPGLRLNKSRKIQIMREFKDDETKNSIIYGKFSKGGCCIAAAGPCILIGIFDENKQHTAAGCNEVITLLARHLIRSPSWGKDEGGSAGGEGDWQSYVDLLLIGKGNVSNAIICSSDTGQIWASTPNFSLKKYMAMITDEDGSEAEETVDEAKNLVQFMSGTSRPKQGLRLNEGKKFQIVKAAQDEELKSFVVNGKIAKGGCWAARTSNAILVAVYDEMKDHTAAGCYSTLSNVIKYLNSL